MPFALALVASALLHAAALVGPGWMLPGTHDSDPPPVIEAVLAKPPAPAEAAPVAKPAPRVPVSKPRPSGAVPVTVPVEAPPAPPAAPTTSAVATTVPAPPPEPPPAAAAPVPAALVPVKTALPAKGRLRYVITRGEGGFVIGQSVHDWEHDGFRYTLKSLTETTGLAAIFKPAQVLQSSQGEVTPEGLKPFAFRHERTGGVDAATFDWQRRVVAYGGREESIVAGTQDMLSMYYQVVLLAPKSGVLEMPIATGRKLEIFRLEVLGEETLAAPGAERRALRIRTRSGNDMIELWLRVGEGADARGLPLKIRFTDRKGEIFDQIADDLDSAETK